MEGETKYRVFRCCRKCQVGNHFGEKQKYSFEEKKFVSIN